MNRSILIVICDFLLVSLLVFSTVDINNVGEDGRTKPMTAQVVATNQPSSGRDLAAAMKTALTEEQKRRDLLTGELNRTREAQQASEQARANLQQQYASAQTNIESLNNQLQTSTTVSSEKMSALEAALQQQKAAAEKLQQQMDASNQLAAAEREKLANDLKVAEVERQSAAAQAAMALDQVKAERAEKAQLAAGVQMLATNSSKLASEIRDYRPMAANTIYSEFVSNRVQATLIASRPGVMSPVFGGTSTKKRDAQTVLVTDGKNIFALSHIEDTPLDLWTPGTDWNNLSGTLSHNDAQVNVQSLSFNQADPRITYIPVSAADAGKLGGKIYKISSDPYKFQDAVLLGTREDYYGECKFEIDNSTPGYVKLDRSVLRGLFGHFNPTRGDLVLSKQGELLGVMANSTYCLMLRNFDAAATFTFGDTKDQHTGTTLAALHSTVMQMQSKLQ